MADVAAEIGRLKLAQGSPRTKGARLSLAGAQEKFALSRDEAGRWHFPMDGYPSSHIVKPEGARFPGIAGNEHTCMELARRSGLEAAETEVGTFGEHEALVVRRFDRKDGGAKLHQEDFCQALGRMEKYQQDPDGPSLKALFTEGPVGGWALWDQILFAWLIGDEDKHAKNVSVLYPEDGSVRLSPVYDAVCTMRYGGLERGMAWKIGNAYHANAVTVEGIGVPGGKMRAGPGRGRAPAARARRKGAHGKGRHAAGRMGPDASGCGRDGHPDGAGPRVGRTHTPAPEFPSPASSRILADRDAAGDERLLVVSLRLQHLRHAFAPREVFRHQHVNRGRFRSRGGSESGTRFMLLRVGLDSVPAGAFPAPEML